jgi:hypothetical protein
MNMWIKEKIQWLRFVAPDFDKERLFVEIEKLLEQAYQKGLKENSKNN